jgi:GST-like protein
MMSDLSQFPITGRWPPPTRRDPALCFPDAQRREGLHRAGGAWPALRGASVTLADADVKSPEFLSLNPNNKIPAIIDPNGPMGAPIALWESGAILIYLAEKTGKLLGATEADKYQVLKWLMFQMGGVGPMFGQLGFFVKFAGAEGRRS